MSEHRLQKNDDAFVKQATVLASAVLISRVIGFFYRLPLTNLIGDEGMGIYSIGYQIYNFLFILSSAGLPVAISKMVSERIALKRFNSAFVVFRVSLFASAVIGTVLSVFLFFASAALANLVGSPESRLTLVTLSPTIILVSVLSVYRGFFQGLGSAYPTAVSQVIEQIANALFSVLFAYTMTRAFSDPAFGAAGGTAGTGAGALFGFAAVVFIYQISKGDIQKKRAKEKGVIVTDGPRKVLDELFRTAIPIIAGTAIFSFTNIIDGAMVKRILSGYMESGEAQKLYGRLANKYVSITTLPVAISSAIATASIPSVAASRVQSKNKETGEKINTAMRLSMIVSMPAACGIGVFASQILLLLFRKYPEGQNLLSVGAVSVVFLALYQITAGMLQGMNRVRIPVIATLCGVAVKIPLSAILLEIPKINALGAVISTIVCYMLASFINVFCLIRLTKIRLDFYGIIIKPAMASALMGMLSYVTYYLLYYVCPYNAVCVLAAILCAAVFYFFIMLFIGAFRKTDVLAMPRGNGIYYFLERRGMAKYLK